MADVALAAGVSAMTVSRALRADSTVAPATRRHILKIVDRLGYVPDIQAQGLSLQRTGFIAALVPSLNNPHFADTVRSLTETLEPLGLQVLVGHTNYEVAREETLITTLLRRRPEAIVLTDDNHSPAALKLLRKAGIPVVQIWDWPQRPLEHVVGFSNAEATAAMVQYLASRTYRRIVYVGETNDTGSRGARRREGYLKAIRALNLGPARLFNIAMPPVSMTQGRAAFCSIREQFPDADAIMCVSDPCAFGIMTEALSQGVRVPDDIALAGFGDFEISRCCSPSLTTVTVDAEQIGAQTGHLLSVLRQADGAPGLSTPARVKLPFGIAARASTR